MDGNPLRKLCQMLDISTTEYTPVGYRLHCAQCYDGVIFNCVLPGSKFSASAEESLSEPQSVPDIKNLCDFSQALRRTPPPYLSQPHRLQRLAIIDTRSTFPEPSFWNRPLSKDSRCIATELCVVWIVALSTKAARGISSRR